MDTPRWAPGQHEEGRAHICPATSSRSVYIQRWSTAFLSAANKRRQHRAWRYAAGFCILLSPPIMETCKRGHISTHHQERPEIEHAALDLTARRKSHEGLQPRGLFHQWIRDRECVRCPDAQWWERASNRAVDWQIVYCNATITQASPGHFMKLHKWLECAASQPRVVLRSAPPFHRLPCFVLSLRTVLA